MNQHYPVLLSEVLKGVAIKPEGRYIDTTFGRGGHTRALLAQLSHQGHLLVIDKDPDAIAFALRLKDPRLIIQQGPFSRLGEYVDALGWQNHVNGIVVDLGVSSSQLDQPERGFSFLRDGPLDMRMNPRDGISASEWINTADEKEMVWVLRTYGEEPHARRIAKAIVHQRKKKKITRTQELAQLISALYPFFKRPKRHPATRSFQAIRLLINQELLELEQVLKQSARVLAKSGRLCVISFHSLEDRLVKQFIAQLAQDEKPLPKDLPIKAHVIKSTPTLKRIGGLIKPTCEEIQLNVRSRSARLRIAEKI